MALVVIAAPFVKCARVAAIVHEVVHQPGVPAHRDALARRAQRHLHGREVAAAGGGLSPYLPYLRYGVLLAAGLLGYFLLVRPLTRTLQRDVTRHYKTVEQMEAEQAAAAGGAAAPGQPRSTDPLERIRREVDADPAFGAHALKNWIRDRG